MLEVLAVLLIFSVLLGIVLIPASRWNRQQRIRSAIAVVRSAVLLAREQAMTRRETVELRLLTMAGPNDTLRSYYWITCRSGDLGPTNRLPDGVCFSSDYCGPEVPYDAVTNYVATHPVAGFHHAVCTAGDPEALGEWHIFATREERFAFAPTGVAAWQSNISMAEILQPRNGLAYGGFVLVSPNTGYVTTDPPLP